MRAAHHHHFTHSEARPVVRDSQTQERSSSSTPHRRLTRSAITLYARPSLLRRTPRRRRRDHRHLFQHHFHERGLSVPECLDSESNLYTYHFTTAPAEDRDESAYHGAELWYTFNNIPYAEHSNFIWTAHNYEVERAMSQYWANGI
ncbi:hypothetical protein IWZ03DRAFT_362430 [Phyllosticta citriasiana]|uniref:Carboxylesterase type B domain-containing protein n=1 Tax=Phyllosticta citriasiana TaxID=595635 RepID=A0ABR1KC19_9PEZI